MSVYNDTFLFIHIPKTAGGSIISSLEKTYKINKIPNPRTKKQNYHSTINDAQNFIASIDDLYSFTVVRNPWDRATSWYHFRKKILVDELSRIKKGKSTKKIINNEKAIQKELNLMEEGFENWIKEYINVPWDFTWFSLADDQTTWLDNFKFSKIIQFEELDKLADIPFFCNIKIENKKNVSLNSQKTYQEFHSRYTRDLISEVYARDIHRFNYTYE